MDSIATKAGRFSVEEMVEAATSLAASGGRTVLINGMTSEIENEFVREILQDGMSAGYSVLTQGVMMAEQALVDRLFSKFSLASAAIVLKSKTRWSKMVGMRGRKGKLLSKVLGQFDNLNVDHARLVADYAAVNATSRNAVGTGQTVSNGQKLKQAHDMRELQAESVKTSMARTGIEAMQNTFEMKLKTSSFTSEDEYLIKQVTKKLAVSQDDIDKLNAFSSAQVFKDSEGNYVGGDQVTAMLMTALRLQGVR